MVFTALEIKTETFKIFINSFKIITNLLQTNIDTIFWKITIFPKQNKKKEGWHWFIVLQISLLSHWVENNWIFLFASLFNMLPCVVLVEVYKWNPALCRYIVGKGRNILIAFLDICGYSFLIAYLKVDSKSRNFLKVGCNVELQTISMRFLYSFVLKFTYLFCILDGSFACAW